MDLEAVKHLQGEMMLAAEAYAKGIIDRMVLDAGSEECDLSANVDIWFHARDGDWRLFSVVSRDFVNWVLEPERCRPRPGLAGIFTLGGATAIVRTITGDSIVRAILRYLELEKVRATARPDRALR